MNLKTFAFALAFAVLLAMPLISAQPPPRGKSFFDLWVTYGWQSVATVAVLISMLIVSIAYMFGISFRQPQITAWAKNELYQALATAFMLAFIIGFVYFLGNFTSQASCAFATCDPGEYARVCGSRQPCDYHIEKAWLIVSNLERKAIFQADELLDVSYRAAALTAVGKYFDSSVGTGTLQWPWQKCSGIKGTCASGASGFGFSWYAGVSMMTDALNLIFPILFSWISSYIAQAVFLALIRDAIFPIFLTMGLILRVFFFTRKLGGLLIAIAIGVYTIYPFMYILLADQYDFQFWEDRFNPYWCDLSQCGDLSHCPARWCSAAMAEIILYGKPVFWDIGVEPVEFNLGGLLRVGQQAFPIDFLFNVTQVIGSMMVPALIIPLINALVTVAFIKNLSPLLGGDVEIAGLTHLI